MQASRDAKQFFVLTAVIEAGAGLALLIAPTLILTVLFDHADIRTGVAVGRLAGAALLSLGAACWWARNDGGGGASRALASGLLIYNATVAALVLAGTLGSLNPLLWAVVAVHGVMAAWCVMLIADRRVNVRA